MICVDSSNSDPLIGRLVDSRYRVIAKIASGGMATVYRAQDDRLGRIVALKIMHAHLAQGEGGANSISRFHREAKASARLTHPGLVAMYDQGTDGDISYLAMEFVSGKNLRALLRTESTLAVGHALEITEQVLDALAAAHSSGLVHRDIKPENVLINQANRVKLADFGLARAVSEVTSTTTGTLLGTVAYLSPELITKGFGDTRSDLYAIGVMLFEMLAGRPPVTGESPIHIAFQHANADIPALSTIISWLDPSVDAFVSSLLDRNPDNRPADASAALAQLRSVVAQLSESDLARRAVPLPTAIPLPPTTSFPASSLELLEEPKSDDATAVDSPVSGSGSEAAFFTEEPAPVQPVSKDRQATFDEELTQALHLTSGSTMALPVDRIRSHQPTRVPRDHGSTKQQGTAKSHSTAQFPRTNTARGDSNGNGSAASLSVSPSSLAHSSLSQKQATKKPQVKKPNPKRSGRKIVIIWLSIVLLLGGLTYGGLYWWNNIGPGAYTLVPMDLEGQPLSSALDKFTDLELEPKVTKAYDDQVPSGTVIKANPQSGTKIAKGATVTLTESLGVEQHEVPKELIGKTEQEATKALNDAGFGKVTKTEEYATGTTAGVVLQMSVEQGKILPHNTKIVLTVSKGSEPIEIPDVVGKTQQDAEAEFAKLELTPEIKEAFDGSIPKGEVISQSPKAFDAGHRGDKVTITVSKGPEMIEVPNVIGKSAAGAREALEGRGFKVEAEYYMGGIFDLVRTQSTDGGKSLPKGSTVAITIF